MVKASIPIFNNCKGFGVKTINMPAKWFSIPISMLLKVSDNITTTLINISGLTYWHPGHKILYTNRPLSFSFTVGVWQRSNFCSFYDISTGCIRAPKFFNCLVTLFVRGRWYWILLLILSAVLLRTELFIRSCVYYYVLLTFWILLS